MTYKKTVSIENMTNNPVYAEGTFAEPTFTKLGNKIKIVIQTIVIC